MNQPQLLAELFYRGVKVWADGDQLRVRAPKGALTQELRDSLAVHKREILSLMCSSTIATRAPHVPLVPVSREGNSPLSFGQERLWHLAQLHPDSPVYNLPKALRFTGPFNVSALGQSIREIVQRHETLRTTFPAVEGQPVQIISSDIPVKLRVVDLRGLHGTDRQAEVQRLASGQSRQPFDLAQGPLLRVKLLQLGEEEHLFFLSAHHMVFDGWSFNVFCRELAALYEAFCTGKPSPLPKLPIQYADFAHWERHWLQNEVLESQLAYWKQQLGGSVPALALPIDSPRPQGQSSQGALQSLVIPQNLTQALKALSQREERTLFVTLLAAFQALLYSYTGQEDVVVCSPVAGRHRSDTKELIGYFTRLLPMRTDLSGNPSFRDVLGRVRRVVSEAYAYQDVPLQMLADFPNLVRTPLSRAMFLLQTPSHLPEPPGLTASLVDVHNGAADFALSLSMEESAAALTGVLEYRTDLFQATTITQMAHHFRTLLQDIVANPDQRISQLPLQIAAERHQLLAVDNDAQTKPRLPQSPSLTSDGKLDPHGPLPPGQVKPGPKGSLMAPRDELELQLTEIWERVLRTKPIGVGDNFFDLGGHSLLAVQLFAQIEKHFGKRLFLATLLQAPTVAQLASLLGPEGYLPPWSSLVALQPCGSKPPFFCMHAGEGEVLHYRDLACLLRPDQPVYGLQAQGLDGERSPHTSIEEMAAHYIQLIRTIQPQGPYFLGGSCLGGVVAFEMAQQLYAQGQKTALLAMLDTGNPHPRKSLRLRAHYGVQLLHHGLQVLRHYTVAIPRYILRNPLPVALERAKSVMLHRHSHNEPQQASRAVSHALSQAYMHYRPRIYQGRITYFVNSKLAWLPLDLWGEFAAHGVALHVMPGNHTEMLFRDVRALAEKLQACLDQAQTCDTRSSSGRVGSVSSP